MFMLWGARWSRDAVRVAVLALRLRGDDPSSQPPPPALRRQAIKYFGSWERAVEESGLGLEWGRSDRRVKGKHSSVTIDTKATKRRMPSRPRRKWSAAAVIRELRERAARKEDLAQGKVGNPLFHAALHYFGSYAKAVEAAGLDYASIRKRPARWSREDVIAKLRELDAAGVKLNWVRVRERAYGIVPAMRREFGTIRRALKEAGLHYYGRKKWNRTKIRSALLQLHRQGKSLSLTKVLKRNRPLVRSAVVYFGSYQKAVEALGLDYRRVSQTEKWSRERIVEELRKLVESGRKANATQVKRASPRLLAASRVYFGGIKQAFAAAGIAYQRHSRWTGVLVARRLKGLADMGEDLSPLAMRRKHPTLVNNAWRLCGSYRKAIEMAGFDYLDVTRHATWDRRSVLRKLKELAARGVDMGYRSLISSHPRVVDAAIRNFGSYPNARVAAGVGAPPLTKWTPEKIVRELRKLARNGESLAASRISRNHPALYDAAYERFKGYGNALAAAGFAYEQVRLARAWTNDSIVAQLRALDAKDVDMRSLALRKVDGGLHMAAYKHFGSYQKALEAAGIEFPPKKPLEGWTKSQVLTRLCELHEAGEDLRYEAMKVKHSPLFFAARYYFDAYIGAVKRAGLDYDRMVREQIKARKGWQKVRPVLREVSAVETEDVRQLATAAQTPGGAPLPQ